jgi:ABC-type nitrate/sulfonate/bicarbonate transport system substrate-binding protein
MFHKSLRTQHIPEAEAILVRVDSPIKPPRSGWQKVAVNRGGWGKHLLLKVLAEAKLPKEKVERIYLGPTDALPGIWATANRQAAAEAFGKAAQLDPQVVNQLGKRPVVEKLLPLNANVLNDIQQRADWMFEQKAVPKQIDIRQSVCPRTPELEKYTALLPN